MVRGDVGEEDDGDEEPAVDRRLRRLQEARRTRPESSDEDSDDDR